MWIGYIVNLEVRCEHGAIANVDEEGIKSLGEMTGEQGRHMVSCQEVQLQNARAEEIANVIDENRQKRSGCAEGKKEC